MKLTRLLKTLVDYQPAGLARSARNQNETLLVRRLEERRVLAAPVLDTTSVNPAVFTEDAAAVQVDPNIEVTDAEDSIAGGTVVISANYQAGADQLHFTNTAQITGVYLNGTLTLVGVATAAQYQDALRSITFSNTSNSPNLNDRTISFTLNDGVASNILDATVEVVGAADTPGVTNATTDEDQQTTTGLVITPNATDNNATHFKITGITNGSLFKNNGTTAINDGDFITLAEGAAGLKFTPDPDFFGVGSFDVKSSTSANDSGLGGATVQADITVDPVAEPPIVPNVNVNEGQDATGLNLDFDPADGASMTHFKITNVTNGTLFYDDGGNMTAVTNGQFLTEAEAQGLEFRPPNQNFVGVGSFDVQTSTNANDAGLSGPVANASITFDAVNDAPVITSPVSVGVAEDGSLAFTGPNLISFVDVDAASGDLFVTLKVDHGTLTLGTDTGLVFDTGFENGEAELRFTGTLANINAALATLTYEPTPGYAGADTLAIEIDDQSNTGSGGAQSDTASVAITVVDINYAPVIIAPATVEFDEGGTFSFDGLDTISFTDADDPGLVMQVTLQVTSGTLFLGSTTNIAFISGTANGQGTLVFEGLIADLNAALATLVFTPANVNFASAVTLDIAVDDRDAGGGGPQIDTAAVAITVAAVNDAPTITVPGAQNINEDQPGGLILTGPTQISIADIDSGSGELLVELSVTNGSIILGSVAGLTFINSTGNGQDVLEFTGTLANINAALATVTYSPDQDYNGTETFTVFVDDQGNTGTGGALTDSDSFDILITAVNDAPDISVPGAQSVDEDDPLVFSAGNGNQISISDPDAAGNQTVLLSVANGTLSVGTTNGLSFTFGFENGQSIVEFTGTLAAINDALATLTYQPDPNYNGPDSLSITVTDDQSQASNVAVAITVNALNDAPVLTAPDDFPAINEDAPAGIPFNGEISIADDDAGLTDELEVTLTVDHGTISITDATGIDFSGGGNNSGNVIMRGTLSELNSALATAVYHPDANYHGSDTLSVTVNDLGITGTPGPLSDSKDVDLTIIGLNDPPIVVVPVAQAVNEDNDLVFALLNANAITINDVDTDLLEVTMSVTHGTLTLVSTLGLDFQGGTENGDATLIFQGTRLEIAAALLSVTYTPDQDYHGADVLDITADDLEGGVTQADVAITVNAINDAPVINADDDNTVNEGATLTFGGNAGAITLEDVDAGATNLVMTIELVNPNGASFAFGPNLGSLVFNVFGFTIQATGTLADLNQALVGSYFTAADNGPVTLRITVNDGIAPPVVHEMDITVENVAPQNLQITPAVNPQEGSPVATVASATDFDALTYSWTVTYGGNQIANGNTNAIFFDPSNDGSYIVALTVNDGDGGVSVLNDVITVANVVPTIVVNATDVDPLRTTTFQITVYDPGADHITISIDWRDISSDYVGSIPYSPPPGDRIFAPIVHRYDVAPNPAQPLAPITVLVTVNDGSSITVFPVTIEVTGRGLPSASTIPETEVRQFSIIASAIVDNRPQVISVPQPVLQVVDIGSSGEQVIEADARKLVLRVVSSSGIESEDYVLPDEALEDLPGFFKAKKLPDGHYRVYLIQGGTDRLVIDTFLRSGRLIDPGDNSDAAIDRPPSETSQSTTEENSTVPPADSQSPEGAGPEGTVPDATAPDDQPDSTQPRAARPDGGDLQFPVSADQQWLNEVPAQAALLHRFDAEEFNLAATADNPETNQERWSRTLLTGAMLAGVAASQAGSWSDKVQDWLAQDDRSNFGKLARAGRRIRTKRTQ
ncbi:MAG: tandem-95 repeat protein [Planctomycetota bacterium]|nr:tandem-95 repeat protein [Planctomycetota bacterium]